MAKAHVVLRLMEMVAEGVAKLRAEEARLVVANVE